MPEITDQYIIQKETLTEIADAVREMRHESEKYTPLQIKEKICSSRMGVPIDVTVHLDPDTGKWVRPVEYPDLDALEIPDDFEGMYLTYDLRKTQGYGWIGLRGNTSTSETNFIVERGYLSGSAFVAEETFEMRRDTLFSLELDEANGLVQLWRVRGDGTNNGHVVRLHFTARSTISSNNYPATLQPCIERRGQLRNVTDLRGEGNTTSNNGWSFCTLWLERDNMVCGGGDLVCTRMDRMYLCAYSLQEVNFKGWDTSNWTINTLYAVFNFCRNLRKIDLSSWDTHNWSVTTINSIFGYCETLTELDLSGWDTHNWEVTSIDSAFRDCESLVKINVTGWDTSNWKVKSVSSLFLGCCNLQFVDLSSWDTSGWEVTNMAGVFQACRSLEKIVFDWDTHNWAVTNLNYAFNNCYCLRKLDLSGWDTSNWTVTSMTSIFNGCYSLESLNVTWDTSKWNIPKLNGIFSTNFALKKIDGISDWDVSNWTVTDLSSLFYMCMSLEHLDLHKWNTSNWAVTAMGSMFNACFSLKDIDISDWDVSNWPVTSMYSMFSDCRSLEEIDLSRWDTSKFAINDVRSCLSYDHHLKRLMLPEKLNLVSTTTNAIFSIDELHSLEQYSGIDNGRGIVYCRYSYRLGRDSLINILNRLETVTGTNTINLGVNKLKLTSEEIAIATQKGWTVA